MAPGLDLGAIADLDIELLGDLIKSVSVGEDTLSLTLDGTALGLSGDIRAELSKQKVNEKWLLEGARFTVQGTEIALSGLAYGQSSEISPVPTTVQYDLTGVGSLGASLIKSLTNVQSGSLSLKDNIYLQGTVTMSAMSMELPIDVYVCIQPQTEEGLVVNARLHYEKNTLFNQGAATVDLTVKGDKIMMRRDIDNAPVQTTTEAFNANIKQYVCYLLNASKIVELFFPTIEIALPDESADLGKKAEHFISDYSGSELTVNGGALLGSKFGDVNVEFGTTEKGAMKIDFSTFVTIILKSTVSGSLTLCEKEEMGYLPTDISG